MQSLLLKPYCHLLALINMLAIAIQSSLGHMPDISSTLKMPFDSKTLYIFPVPFYTRLLEIVREEKGLLRKIKIISNSQLTCLIDILQYVYSSINLHVIAVIRNNVYL